MILNFFIHNVTAVFMRK